MMSRPLVSAPRKNLACQVGPIGTPSGATTSFFFPSMVIWSVMWLADSVVLAT